MIRLYISICFILIFSFITSCDKKQNNVPSNQKLNFIKTAKVIRRNFVRKITEYGYVKPLIKENIVVYTKGIIKHIWVTEGEWVKRGKRILSIEGYYRIKAKESGISYNSGAGNNIVKIAPISGYITSLHKIVGNAVNSGEIITSIVDLKNMLIKIEVFGNKAELVKTGQIAMILHNHKKFEGKVVSISPIINPQNGGRTVGIKIVQPQPPKLFPGEFVKTEIIVEKHNNVVSVPQDAVLNDNGKKIVLVKTGKGYKKTKISTGLKEKGYVEIVSGLKGNETVITTGAYEIFNKDINKKIKIED